MRFHPAATPTRLAAVAAALALGACTTIGNWFSDDKVDYRNAPVKTQPLEVPPDLTQLARDSRYQPQGGVISASSTLAPAAAAASAAAAAPGQPTVALTGVDGMHIERDGQYRWLVVPQTPEQLWPQLRAFWEKQGFTVDVDNPQSGVMQTNWLENRAKLSGDIVRTTIGKIFSDLTDTGERDQYSTRVERTPKGSEVYVTLRGVVEVYTSERHETTGWQARPPNPQLEAEMLSRLMLALAHRDEQPVRTAQDERIDAPVRTAPIAAPSKTRPSTLVLDESFDRAWRRVGLALDRGSFTVEDRDRAAGLYYVRYVDPKNAGKEEPGWWARLFGDKSNPQAALRYRIVVKPEGDGKKTLVAVQNATGAPETGDNAQRIVGLLVEELK